MGTLSSGNTELQALWIPMLLVQAQASILLNPEPQVLADLLLEDVEAYGWLDTGTKSLTNHQGQHWPFWELQGLPLISPQSGLAPASSGASVLSQNFNYRMTPVRREF